MATSLHEDGLISKTKSMVLSLCGIISRPSSNRLYSPMQTPEDPCMQLPGLKTLTCHPNPLITHSYNTSTTPHSSSLSSDYYSQSLFRSLSTHSSLFSSWSSGMDDMLGTESGVYMSPNALKLPEMDPKPNDNKSKRSREREMMMNSRREYPPPIPLLSRTGNLTCYMPWLLKRHYRNGRLVLTEEKRKHHEYFEAYRENGRLVLDLVPLDDTFICCHSVRDENNDDDIENLDQFLQGEDYQLEKVDEETEAVADDDDDDNDYQGSSTIPIPLAFSVPKFYHGNERYGDPRRCLTYSGRILSESSPSMFCNAGGDHQEKEAPFSFYNILSSMTPTHVEAI